MRDAASPHSTDARAVPLKNIIAVGGKKIIIIDDEIASKLDLTDGTIIEQYITDKGILMKIRSHNIYQKQIVVESLPQEEYI